MNTLPPVPSPVRGVRPVRRRSRSLALAVLAGSLLACHSSTSPPDEPRGIEGSELVFASQDPASLEWSLFRERIDAGERRRFEHPRAGVEDDLPDRILQQPRWSPDGERLIYRASATNTDDWYLVMVDSAGRHRRLLTPHSGFMDFAEWSPRGDRILYHRGGLVGGQLGVLVQTSLVDTLGVRRDFFVEEEGGLFEGRRVFFSLSPVPGAGLYDAQWASDGAHLVLVGFLDRPAREGVGVEQVELFRVRISDGRVVERVSRNAVDESGFVLSPDGRRVLLSRQDAGPRRLLVGDLPALATTEVAGPVHDGPPRWVADSRHVVFSSVDGIYLAEAGGTGAERVAAGPGLNWPDLFCPGCR